MTGAADDRNRLLAELGGLLDDIGGLTAEDLALVRLGATLERIRTEFGAYLRAALSAPEHATADDLMFLAMIKETLGTEAAADEAGRL